jgi:hypothetical protein
MMRCWRIGCKLFSLSEGGKRLILPPDYWERCWIAANPENGLGPVTYGSDSRDAKGKIKLMS